MLTYWIGSRESRKTQIFDLNNRDNGASTKKRKAVGKVSSVWGG